MEQKQNSGAIFRNNKKETEKHPDYTGKLNVEGKNYFVSAWINESQNGTKYMALKLSEPKAETVASVNAPTDDLPF